MVLSAAVCDRSLAFQLTFTRTFYPNIQILDSQHGDSRARPKRQSRTLRTPIIGRAARYSAARLALRKRWLRRHSSHQLRRTRFSSTRRPVRQRFRRRHVCIVRARCTKYTVSCMSTRFTPHPLRPCQLHGLHRVSFGPLDLLTFHLQVPQVHAGRPGPRQDTIQPEKNHHVAHHEKTHVLAQVDQADTQQRAK